MLAYACEVERVGQPHPALAPAAVHIPEEHAARYQDALVGELKSAGLADSTGRPTADFVDLLVPLCKPSLDYVGYFSFDGAVRVAASMVYGAMAVVAIRDGDTIMMREIGEHELVDALLGEMPELTPGNGPLLSVNIDKIREDRAGITSGPQNRDLKELLAMAEREVIETMEITIHTNEDGRRRKSRSPLSIALTDWGHFISYALGTGRDEELWGGPATYENVHQALGQLRSDLVTVGA